MKGSKRIYDIARNFRRLSINKNASILAKWKQNNNNLTINITNGNITITKNNSSWDRYNISYPYPSNEIEISENIANELQRQLDKLISNYEEEIKKYLPSNLIATFLFGSFLGRSLSIA